jgi:hypothetical protein
VGSTPASRTILLTSWHERLLLGGKKRVAMSDEASLHNPDATAPKAAIDVVLCPKCYHLNGVEAPRCVHCHHSLYVKCISCGQTNFRGLDVCHHCHHSLRHIHVVHITKPGTLPIISRTPRVAAFSWAGLLLGCLMVLGIIEGVNRLLDDYERSHPPVEYTIGLPPHQNLIRHSDLTLPK